MDHAGEQSYAPHGAVGFLNERNGDLTSARGWNVRLHGILQQLFDSCALGRESEERVTIEPTQTHTDTDKDGVRHNRLKLLRSVIERT